MDALFWRCVGYWLAEGSCDLVRSRIVFALGPMDEAIVEDLELLAKRYGAVLRKRLTPPARGLQCRVVSRQWCELFDGQFGHGARQKQLPIWVFGLPREFRRELLYGYWRGDGCRGKRDYRIASANLGLLRSMQQLAATVGAWTTVRREPLRAGHDRYSLRLSFQSAALLRLDGAAQMVRRQRRGRGVIRDGWIWRPILSVHRVTADEEFCDLQTVDGAYQLPQALSHNSDDAYALLRRGGGGRWRWLIQGVDAEFGSLVTRVAAGAELDDAPCGEDPARDAAAPLRAAPPRAHPPGTAYRLPLWSRWPAEALRAEHRKDPRSFNRGFRQWSRKDADRLFTQLGRFLVGGGATPESLGVYPDAPRVGGYDPAGERRRGHALVTAALTASGVRVVTEMRLWAGSYAETQGHLVAAQARHRYHLCVVENVATQGAIIQLVLDKAPAMPLVPHVTGANKAHLELGLPGLAAEILHGAWALCLDYPYDTGAPLSAHDPGCQCAYHVFLADLDAYPAAGRAYDLLMALWFCCVGFRGALAADAGGEERAGGIPEDEILGSFLSEEVRVVR